MDIDALLLLSFGGPEGPDQVMPFLENVTRGRGIPQERLAAVAEHYLHFDGVSPINGINRALIDALRGLIDIPVYFGNRNWEPYIEDAVTAMAADGIRSAAVFATSAWGGYSGCTQYVEDIARARRAAGDAAPQLVKLRQFYDHPLFVAMFSDAITDGGAGRRGRCAVGVHRTLHSAVGQIPLWHRAIRAAGGVRRQARRRRRGVRRL